MPADPAETIISTQDDAVPEGMTLRGSTADNSNEERSRIAVDGGQSSADLTERVDEATRVVLHRRLMVAVVAIVCGMVVVTGISAVLGDLRSSEFLPRMISVIVLLGLFVRLHQVNCLSLPRLRRIELLVVAVPVLEIILAQVTRTQTHIAAGETETVATLRAITGTAVSLVIAVHGIFIPCVWIRTAWITGTAACLPTVVAVIHAQTNPELPTMEAGNYVMLAMTLCMAAIATVGSQVVHTLRREIEVARQYGQYRLTDEIGRGAMGVVYRAEHRLLKRPAAIKLIRSNSAADDATIAQFEQEVQICATLSHWNTVQIYDYGRTARGDFYYVMECLEGQSLRQLLDTQKTLDVAATIAIVRQVCAGLAEAHDRGMVHRDLKPANIFLANIGGRSDVVKIVDFGLATIPSKATGLDHGAICGTPLYMSPEQIRGEPVDRGSDIYAIGCVLVECLSGRPPFEADTVVSLLDRHLHDTPTVDTLPGIRPDLRKVIARCLKKQSGERFENVQSLNAALNRLMD